MGYTGIRQLEVYEASIQSVCLGVQEDVDRAEYMARHLPDGWAECVDQLHQVDFLMAHVLQDVASLLPPEVYMLVQRALRARDGVYMHPSALCQAS